MSPFTKREVMPGNLAGLESFVRKAASTYWRQACTAKMGRYQRSVVDGGLQVYVIDNLAHRGRKIMPRVIIGNIMVPCVVLGEKAAEFLKVKQAL
jgi:choline dehydrogenase